MTAANAQQLYPAGAVNARGGQAQASPAPFDTLHHWSEVQLAALADGIGAACAVWRGDWLGAVRPGVHDAIEDAVRAEQLSGLDRVVTALPLHARAERADRGPACAWLSCEAAGAGAREVGPLQVVSQLLWDRSAPLDGSGIAGGVARGALDALMQALQGVLALPAAAPCTPAGAESESVCADDFAPWRGGVRVALTIGAFELMLHLNSACVHGVVPANPAPSHRVVRLRVPVQDAVRGVAMRVRAQFQPVELTLGHLQSLQLGDVIVLPHALDEPLSLRGDGGELGRAFLVRQDGQRAIELLRTKTNDTN